MAADFTLTALLWMSGLVLAAGAPLLFGQVETAPAQSCTSATCHGEITQGPQLHPPAESKQCDVCHVAEDPSQAYRAGRGHEFTLASEPESELCRTCHEEIGEEDVVHGPVKQAMCVICHDPHRSDYERLLRVTPTAALCFLCHKDSLRIGKVVHPPVADGQCLVCHDPHSSANRSLLRTPTPQLCMQCHEELGEDIEDAAFKHKVLAGPRPCLSCHDPHRSDQPALQPQEQVKLCLSCHDKIKSRLVGRKYKHGPVGEGQCTACHDPHAGDTRPMLKASFSPVGGGDSAAEQYALCFGACHDEQLVLAERTTTKTGFRDGELNLHFVHVCKASGGLSCLGCHDVHASDRPKQMAAVVALGPWRLPIGFEKTQTGGRCGSGCHGPSRYDR